MLYRLHHAGRIILFIITLPADLISPAFLVTLLATNTSSSTPNSFDIGLNVFPMIIFFATIPVVNPIAVFMISVFRSGKATASLNVLFDNINGF